eukprot:TRINITY_DN5363_c0_g1_i5.p1 TRINITY_DN5363_c0_g1~~TRINITY_DN5363_c0_g1_i5.p1  ORF type:complete len:628 (-),score=29.29 TRINITY_DN5363_c0_g1_i5:2610-4493(-)
MRHTPFRIVLRQFLASLVTSLAIRLIIVYHAATLAKTQQLNSNQNNFFSQANNFDFSQTQCVFNQQMAKCDVNGTEFLQLLEKSANPYASFLQCTYINEENRCKGNKYCVWGQVQGGKYFCTQDNQFLKDELQTCFGEQEHCLYNKPTKNTHFAQFACSSFVSEQIFMKNQSSEEFQECQLKSNISQFCEVVGNLNSCLLGNNKASNSSYDLLSNVCSGQCTLFSKQDGCNQLCWSEISSVDKMLLGLLTTNYSKINFECKNSQSQNCTLQEEFFWRPPKVSSLAPLLFDDVALQQSYVAMTECWSRSKTKCEKLKNFEVATFSNLAQVDLTQTQDKIPQIESSSNSNTASITDSQHLLLSVLFICFLAMLQFILGLVIYCRHSIRQEQQEIQRTNNNELQERQQNIELVQLVTHPQQQQQQQQQQQPYHHFILEEANSPFITNLPELLLRLKDFTVRNNQQSKEEYKYHTCAICLDRFVQLNKQNCVQNDNTQNVHEMLQQQSLSARNLNRLNSLQDQEIFNQPPNIDILNYLHAQNPDDIPQQEQTTVEHVALDWHIPVDQKDVEIVVDVLQEDGGSSSMFEVDGREVLKLNCGHFFHHDCLREWVIAKEEKVECPTCRAFIFQE